MVPSGHDVTREYRNLLEITGILVTEAYVDHSCLGNQNFGTWNLHNNMKQVSCSLACLRIFTVVKIHRVAYQILGCIVHYLRVQLRKAVYQQ